MTFLCAYCGVDHPDHFRAEEHIIPRRLGSGKFVHRNTCLRVNHGLSHAVEKPFHRQSTIDEILATLDPPKGSGPHFRATLATERGTEENLYIYKGTPVLADLPQYSKTNVVEVTLHRQDGTSVPYSLKLPFEITEHATGSEILLTGAKAQKILKNAEQNLLEYARRLKDNPAIDPEFEEFVRNNNIVLKDPVAIPTVQHASKPNDPIADVLPRRFEFSIELAARYFIKTALLYGAETGQTSLLGTPIASVLRSFLTEFFLPSSIAFDDAGQQLPVVADATIAGRQEYWWAAPTDVSLVCINSTPNIANEKRAQLLAHHQIRVLQLATAQRHVSFVRTGSVDPEFYSSPGRYGYHELEFFRREDTSDLAGIWCSIRLFGGVLTTHVRLSTDANMSFTRSLKRIETPWYAP